VSSLCGEERNAVCKGLVTNTCDVHNPSTERYHACDLALYLVDSLERKNCVATILQNMYPLKKVSSLCGEERYTACKTFFTAIFYVFDRKIP